MRTAHFSGWAVFSLSDQWRRKERAGPRGRSYKSCGSKNRSSCSSFLFLLTPYITRNRGNWGRSKIVDAHNCSDLIYSLIFESPDIAAQVIYSVRKEQCLRATDFLLRRSLMGFSPDQGFGALPGVIVLMGEELGWSATKKNEEFEAHMQWVHQTQQALS